MYGLFEESEELNDSSNDSSGMRGIWAAERIYQRLGWAAFTNPSINRDYSRVENNDGVKEDLSKLEIFADIALPRFLGGMNRMTIRKRLFNLDKAGYPVKPYSGLRESELRAYFDEVRADIRARSTAKIPDVIRRINQYNVSLQLFSS